MWESRSAAAHIRLYLFRAALFSFSPDLFVFGSRFLSLFPRSSPFLATFIPFQFPALSRLRSPPRARPGVCPGEGSFTQGGVCLNNTDMYNMYAVPVRGAGGCRAFILAARGNWS